MFAVMLAFVILFALQSYQRARTGSSAEAVAITELNSIAEVFQSPSSDRLQGGLVCYARAVVNDEWPAMRNGHSSELVESSIDQLVRDFAATELHGAKEESAYAQWFDQQAQRREGRRERLAEASPLVSVPLWLVLGLSASLTIAYMCAQADRREGVLVQALPIGFVTAIMTGALCVVFFLDHPYTTASGGIAPTEMQRTLTLIDGGTPAPCDERGTRHA